MTPPRPIAPGLFTTTPGGPRLCAAGCEDCQRLHFPAGDSLPVLRRRTLRRAPRRRRRHALALHRPSPPDRPAIAAPCRTASASSSCRRGCAWSRGSPRPASRAPSRAADASRRRAAARRRRRHPVVSYAYAPERRVRPVYVARHRPPSVRPLRRARAHRARRACRARRARRGRRRTRRLRGGVLRHASTAASPRATRCSPRSASGRARSSTSRPAAPAAVPRSRSAPRRSRPAAHERVLVLRLEKMPRGMIRSCFFEPWREEAGLAATPGYFALRAQRLMRESDVRARGPGAHLREEPRATASTTRTRCIASPSTVEQVLALAGGLRAAPPAHAVRAQRGRGGRRPVVDSTARRAGRSASPRLRLRSHLAGNVLGEHTPLSGLVDDGMPTPTEMAAPRRPTSEAGVGPARPRRGRAAGHGRGPRDPVGRGARPLRARRRRSLGARAAAAK